MMLLFVGLGNPESKYDFTPHNVGFMILDCIQQTLSFPPFKSSSDFSLSSMELFEKRIILLKPMRFMNHSGQSIGKVVKFYKITNNNVVVFHDDIDLKLGSIKVKKGGGNAGHNGLKSIDSFIGRDYWRVRFGVGRPEDKNDVSKYVLSRFKDLGKVSISVQNIVNDIQILVNENKSLLMNKINILY